MDGAELRGVETAWSAAVWGLRDRIDFEWRSRGRGRVGAELRAVRSNPFAALRSSADGDWFRPEMGLFWAIAARHRRMGYASEAAAELASFAFQKLRLARIVATTEHDNSASIGVMRRIGMTIERNPRDEPIWFQTVGILRNPERLRAE
jgi:RimJ/RimL family protein N-acetyltransferase